MPNDTIHVKDSLQNYEYELSQPVGKNFDPDFKPELTPQEMLELGVFGGNYFGNEYDEFPESWFERARICKQGRDYSLNFFETKAGQSLGVWHRKGWIHEEDPRGWFQWYCRYYMGRRIPEEDRRQISRWKMMTRHIGQLKKACLPGDLTCRRRQRQALLQWAYDSRKI